MNDNKCTNCISWLFIIFSLLYVGVPLFIDIILKESYLIFTNQPQMFIPNVLGTETLAHFWFSIYSLVPLLLVPCLVGLKGIFGEEQKFVRKNARMFLTFAIIAMMISGMLLPSFNWYIAFYERQASPEIQQILIAVANAMNVYIVKFIGMGFGGVCLGIWFILGGFLLRKSADTRQWLSLALIILGVIFLLLIIVESMVMGVSLYEWIDLKAITALWFFIFGVAIRAV